MPVDCIKVIKALKGKGQTLKRQWCLYDSEGIINGKKPYSYRQFCQKIDEYRDNNGESITHILRTPGENIEFDYAGMTLAITSRTPSIPDTKVTIFIATLSYSNYFYAEGLTKCDEKNWIRVCNNALWYFGGITPIVTPDNAKIAVIENKDWIAPKLNETFQN